MSHVTDRLLNRVKPDHLSIARAMLAQSDRYDNAAIIATVATAQTFHNGQGSNGDTLALIVRNHYPVTLMYCRHQQANAGHLRVNQVVKLA